MVVTKLKEWVTAVKLEYNYTKEEIVAMYLNTVFYGSNAYGIKAAAKTFFDKEPSELNVQEAALLVGVVNAPTRYSPVRNPERALARRNTVMTRMQQNRYITRGELDSLKQEPIELRYAPISHNDGIATYFREMVRNVLNMPRPTKNSTAGITRPNWHGGRAIPFTAGVARTSSRTEPLTISTATASRYIPPSVTTCRSMPRRLSASSSPPFSPAWMPR